MNIKLIVDFDELKYKTKVQMDALINLTVFTIVPFFKLTAVPIQTPSAYYQDHRTIGIEGGFADHPVQPHH